MKTIQSIDRAIFVLELVSKQNGKLTLTDISTALEMKITTLHGIISTLEYRGFLYKKQNSGKYRLGAKLFEMGKIYESDVSLIDKVHPYLESLSDEFCETVHLAVPYDNQILYIDKVESKHPLRLTSLVGTVEKAYDSAIGLVILAHLPEPDLENFVDGFDNKETALSEKQEISHIFKEIKKHGYYIKFEKQNDFYCIATPILNTNASVVGAISIVIPHYRYNDALSKLIIDKLIDITSSLEIS